MQNNRKMHLNYKTMILFPQNELQNILGNTIYAVPGGQIHPFLQKKTPIIGIIQINILFEPLDHARWG